MKPSTSSEKWQQEEDVESMNSSSSLLNKQKAATSLQQPDIPMCGCLSVPFYQPYFDVDTEDIFKRISHAMFFCRREELFLQMVDEKPDAYGPVWIATTLVFVIAVTSHMSSWLSSWMKGTIWAYDFQAVVTVSSLVFGFAAAVPVAIWLLFRQLEAPIKLSTSVCLYGYSLFVFLPASLVCLIPNELIHWLALFVAACLSALFLLRNLAPAIVERARQQAAVLLALIGCAQLALMLSIKILFY